MCLVPNGARPPLRLRTARALRPRARNRPQLRPPTFGGHLNKTYGQMPEGLTGHFLRVYTGLPDEWKYRADGCWVAKGTSAPCVLLLVALQVLLAYMPLDRGKTNLP